MFQSETDRVSTLISQHSQSLNAITVQSLDKLLNSKKQAKKRFTTCRQVRHGWKEKEIEHLKNRIISSYLCFFSDLI